MSSDNKKYHKNSPRMKAAIEKTLKITFDI